MRADQSYAELSKTARPFFARGHLNHELVQRSRRNNKTGHAGRIRSGELLLTSCPRNQG